MFDFYPRKNVWVGRKCQLMIGNNNENVAVRNKILANEYDLCSFVGCLSNIRIKLPISVDNSNRRYLIISLWPVHDHCHINHTRNLVLTLYQNLYVNCVIVNNTLFSSKHRPFVTEICIFRLLTLTLRQYTSFSNCFFNRWAKILSRTKRSIT